MFSFNSLSFSVSVIRRLTLFSYVGNDEGWAIDTRLVWQVGVRPIVSAVSVHK